MRRGLSAGCGLLVRELAAHEAQSAWTHGDERASLGFAALFSAEGSHSGALPEASQWGAFVAFPISCLMLPFTS
jgi:hypothetical protein